MSKQFAVTMQECAAIDLTGINVVTEMQNASVECPKLWEAFGPQIMQTGGFINPENIVSYGVSFMLDMQKGTFEYWAAVPTATNAVVPASMGQTVVPAGTYAVCQVPSLHELGPAYMYVYGQWIAENPEYALDMSAPCYEKYTAEYVKNGSLQIFVKIIQK